MASPMRPWTRRLLDLIDEGITDHDELVSRAVPWVPQGHAFRTREESNARFRRRYAVAHPTATPRGNQVRRYTPTELHRVGARLVLTRCLRNLVRTGRLVRDGTTYTRPAGRRSEGAA